jgi:flagellar FliL protein
MNHWCLRSISKKTSAVRADSNLPPGSGRLLAAHKPQIQHEIILLLSGKDAATLRTLAGKKELIEELVELANHAIHEDEKTGIKEALFTRFLIQ